MRTQVFGQGISALVSDCGQRHGQTLICICSAAIASVRGHTFVWAVSHHCRVPAEVSVMMLLSPLPWDMQTASPALPTSQDCTCCAQEGLEHCAAKLLYLP